jgi:hypothetical protein
MSNQTPLPDKNEIRRDLKLGIALPFPPGFSAIPPGAHIEARNMLLRFNLQLIGFGIVSPSPKLCPGMSAPNQFCFVETVREKNPENQQ